ncbi:MAG TPA: VOC family protein [Nitrospira sp.]|nr:VOC family protein [Nitrospira sp.]
MRSRAPLLRRLAHLFTVLLCYNLAMGRRYDHMDVRVRNLEEVREFYVTLLPALGFTRRRDVEGWLSLEAARSGGATEFFGITESAHHLPNECRIAFWAESNREVDRLADIAVKAGAQNVEGPGYGEGPGYYAVFFEDPSGNRLEICHREDQAA